MDELLIRIKEKLDEMRDAKTDTAMMDFRTLAQIYQVVCLMERVKGIIAWGDNGYA